MVRLASAPAWLMGAALVVIVAVAAVWASVGTVASTVAAPGVLIHADGVSTLDATTAGQVVKWYVAPDDLATKGAPLYSVAGTDGQVRTVSAPWDAYVVSVVVTNGQYVQPGTPIATLEEVTGGSDPLEAVVFIPAAAAPTIPLGTRVTLSAPSAPSSIFGTLSGTVASVGNFPETTDSLQAFLGEGGGTQSSSTPAAWCGSWSSWPRCRARDQTRLVKPSPGYTLDSEAAAEALFVVSKQHPIDWLFGRWPPRPRARRRPGQRARPFPLDAGSTRPP